VKSVETGSLVSRDGDFPRDFFENAALHRAHALRCAGFVILPMAPRSLFGVGMLIAFVFAQLCDGVLTYIGVHTFGLGIEANPIVSWYIGALGAGMALLAAKGLAIACAVLLYRFAHYRTIGVLTVMYLTMAVQPWVSLLLAN
jgi:uncharacterized membrane protein